jgi:hypothetical protein
MTLGGMAVLIPTGTVIGVSPANPVLRFRAAAVELNFHATAISGVKPSSATRLVISSR